MTTHISNISVFARMTAKPTSDEELMLAFQGGQLRAYEELLKRHRHGVYNFILRFLGNPETSEEVFQEVFIKVHRAAANYLPNGKFTTWLYTIVRNQCVDTFRRQKLREALSLDAKSGENELSLADTLPSEEVGPDVMSSAAQIEEILEFALGKHNADQREVFLLREKKGFKFEEIAEMTGTSVNTVKSRMRYALETLRKTLKQSRYRDLLEE